MDRQAEPALEFSNKCIHFPGFESRRAVHIIGIANDEFSNFARGNFAGHLGKALFGVGGNCGRQGNRQAEFVAKAQPPALGAIIKTEEGHWKLKSKK